MREIVEPQQMPWKNGRGVTTQIAISPPDATVASGFDWRVSMARVEEDGPFSRFPGCDRVLVVLDGAGLRIGENIVRPLQPFRFSGDDEVSGALLGGPVRDFNVISRRRINVTCEVVGPGVLSAGGDVQFVTCFEGALCCGVIEVHAGSTLRAIDGGALALTGEGRAIHVRIRV